MGSSRAQGSRADSTTCTGGAALPQYTGRHMCNHGSAGVDHLSGLLGEVLQRGAAPPPGGGHVLVAPEAAPVGGATPAAQQRPPLSAATPPRPVPLKPHPAAPHLLSRGTLAPLPSPGGLRSGGQLCGGQRRRERRQRPAWRRASGRRSCRAAAPTRPAAAAPAARATPAPSCSSAAEAPGGGAAQPLVSRGKMPMCARGCCTRTFHWTASCRCSHRAVPCTECWRRYSYCMIA